MKLLISCILLSWIGCYVNARASTSKVTDRSVRLTRDTTKVSLAGGRWLWEGVVKISTSDGNTGSMCAERLSGEDRSVICKSMFYHRQNIFGWPINTTAYGGDLEPRVLDVDLRCDGYEDDVTQCPGFNLTWADKQVCKEGESAIRCTSGLGVEFLRPKHTPDNSGRPEIFVNGTWGTFCSKGFDDFDATMVCAFGDYWTSYGKITSGSSYGNSTVPSLVENFQCEGNEPSADFCTWDSSTCSSDEDVGLECEERFLGEGDIQLTDGGFPWKGRVEVYLSNRNTTVSFCAGELWFSEEDAHVVCRSLNYRHGGKLQKPVPVSPSAPEIIEQLHCYGNEKNIGQCAARWTTDSYDCPTYPPLVAAIDCSDGIKVKLSSGKRPFEGTVQMNVDGHWYNLDSASVRQNEAKVLCSTMGWSNTKPHVFPPNTFHAPNQPHITMHCDDDNARIVAQCDIKTHPVNHAKHASIHCFDCSLSVFNKVTWVLTSENYPAPVSEDSDCMYQISSLGYEPKSSRFFFEDLTLGDDDNITIQENPMAPVIATYSGCQGPADVIFTHDLYIRIRAHAGFKFRFKWEPVTVRQRKLEDAVSVQCSMGDMKVYVNLTKLKTASVDNDPAHLSLSDEACRGVTYGSVWSATSNHSACKTQRQVHSEDIVYKNAVVYSIPGGNPGDVTHKWKVDVDCVFRRNITARTNYSSTDGSKIILQINTTSQYIPTLRLYTDAGLNHEIGGQGVRVKLGSDLYAEVNFTSEVNVRPRLQSCSLKDNAIKSHEYQLIQNGCSADYDTNIISQTANDTVFHFKAVEFVAGVTSAYLTCDVIYCLPDDPSQACKQQCNSTSGGRREAVYRSVHSDTISRFLAFL